MPQALSTGINLDKAVADIEGLESNFDALRGILQQEIDSAVEETAKEFRDEVKKQIIASEIDSDTGELLNSWVVRPKGLARYEVRSTADHAIYLELGTRPHTITGNPFLVFEPEPGTLDQYPDKFIRGDGLVQIHGVNHPGNEAYGYFQDAFDQRSWKTTLNNHIRRARDRAIEKAGFDI